MKTYSELTSLSTFDDRFHYLKLDGLVGNETFGRDRYLNQILYTSSEWRRFRDRIIVRDKGCDMALDGYDIGGKIIIHHINPITLDDVVNRNPCVFDENNVVCVSVDTHNGIHYGNESFIPLVPKERTPMDTCPWKRQGGWNGR